MYFLVNFKGVLDPDSETVEKPSINLQTAQKYKAKINVYVPPTFLLSKSLPRVLSYQFLLSNTKCTLHVSVTQHDLSEVRLLENTQLLIISLLLLPTIWTPSNPFFKEQQAHFFQKDLGAVTFAFPVSVPDNNLHCLSSERPISH